MHQIRFRLGLRPEPLGELAALPQTPVDRLMGRICKRRGEGNGEGRGKGRREGECLTSGAGIKGPDVYRYHMPTVHCLHAYRTFVYTATCKRERRNPAKNIL